MANDPAWKRAGFATPNAYTKANRQSQQWSAKSSRQSSSRWDNKMSPEDKGAYYRAFVSGNAKNSNNSSGKGGSRALRYFLVTLTGRVSEEQWAEKYERWI